MLDFPVSIIGAGNVAHHFIYRLNLSEIHPTVFCRNPEKSRQLNERFNLGGLFSIDELTVEKGLLIVAINDDSIGKLNFKTKALTVHTAGSLDSTMLQSYSDRTGYIYPLQSLKVDNYMDSSIKIPLLLHTDNEADLDICKRFAQIIRSPFRVIDHKEKLKVHLAAVFANNFSNHMLDLANRILEKENIDFDILQPLIETTFNSVKHLNPKETQTGPAIRKDEETLNKHLDLLKDQPELADLYRLVSKSIAGE